MINHNFNDPSASQLENTYFTAKLSQARASNTSLSSCLTLITLALTNLAPKRNTLHIRKVFIDNYL